MSRGCLVCAECARQMPGKCPRFSVPILLFFLRFPKWSLAQGGPLPSGPWSRHCRRSRRPRACLVEKRVLGMHLVLRKFEVEPLCVSFHSHFGDLLSCFSCVSSRCWLARQCGLTIARGLLHWVRRSGSISSASKSMVDLAPTGFCSVIFCLELLVWPSPKALEILEFGSCDVHQQVWACWVLVRVMSASTRTPATQLAHLSSDFEPGHGFLVGFNCSAATGSKLALRLSVTPCLKAFKILGRGCVVPPSSSLCQLGSHRRVSWHPPIRRVDPTRATTYPALLLLLLWHIPRLTRSHEPHAWSWWRDQVISLVACAPMALCGTLSLFASFS